MTRRVDRRRERIVDILREHGPLPASAIARLVSRFTVVVYDDLAALEHEGRIVGYWGDAIPGSTLRRRMWRLATDDEQRDHRRRLEQVEAAKPAGRTRPLRAVPKPCGGAA
jgi:DeoR/GlpR family transcriptional regulator of sugar metabolism